MGVAITRLLPALMLRDVPASIVAVRCLRT